ncbi:MAG: thioredoxin domain-containing protein [Patescibacteria group bacterium]
MEKADTGSFMEKYMTPIAVIVGALIIAGAFAFGRGDGMPTQPGEQAAKAVNIKDVKDNGPFLGDKNAPVVMAYWFDYQCPFCKQFEQTAMVQIYDTYVATGKVKILIKDFQFLGPDSEAGALYSRAVWEAHPELYYEWYKAMFVAQDEEHGGFGDEKSVDTLTRGVAGIDGDRVAALVASNRAKYLEAIAADRAEGSALGVTGTPAMIVGKSLLAGAQPFASVAALIDAELK